MSELPRAWRADTRPTSSAAGPFCLGGLDACAVEHFRRAAHARADSVWAVSQEVVVLLLLVVFAVDLPVVPAAAVFMRHDCGVPRHVVECKGPSV